MKLKKFNEYNHIKENILDDDNDNIENKWEIRIDDGTDSFWEYKHDAIDRILEILDTTGDENGLDDYEDPEEEYSPSLGELADQLDDMDEADFYEKLEELKEFVGYDNDIKMINIADDDELEFLDYDSFGQIY